MQSLFNLWQRTCQQEAPGGGLFSSITSSLFNLAALIVWNATMLWIQGHKNLHFQWYWLLSRISSFFPWSGNCTLVISSITLFELLAKILMICILTCIRSSRADGSSPRPRPAWRRPAWRCPTGWPAGCSARACFSAASHISTAFPQQVLPPEYCWMLLSEKLSNTLTNLWSGSLACWSTTRHVKASFLWITPTLLNHKVECVDM